MATKTRVVLDLNTRVKVIHASERDKLSVVQKSVERRLIQDAVKSLKDCKNLLYNGMIQTRLE
jgi:hypothetical protein